MMTDLAKQLKEGTKESHSAAENTKFVASFLRGVISNENYGLLVANFYFVYRAMEEEINKLEDNPIVSKLIVPGLGRRQALAADCEYFYGENWSDHITPSEACQQYVNRIRDVAATQPELLVAHAYTRYMGDLSGGQILKGIAEKALLLTDGGLDFYEFPEIPDTKAFKVEYRAALDGLDLDQHQINAIITEANYAFRLNMYMFEELEGSAIKALMKMLCSMVKGKG